MTPKEEYKKLCTTVYIPIFSKYWWLDAVTIGKGWDVTLSKESGQIVGAFPYCIQKYAIFFRGIFNPQLTQRMSYYIQQVSDLKAPEKSEYEQKIFMELFVNLPKHSLFSINFHYSFNCENNFIDHGYKVVRKYSYCLDNWPKLDDIYDAFHKRTKRHIKKSSSLYDLEESNDVNAFYQLNKMSFNRKNLKIPYTCDFLNRIDEACGKRGCKKIIMAYDDGIPVAGIYLVWDEKYLYYLASGVDQDHRSSGVSSLLVWEGIQLAASKNLIFDFEGSMLQTIESFFKAFSPKKRYYKCVYRYNNFFMKMYMSIK